MTTQIKIGRAKNAVLNYFERSLSVPKIYLEANWNGVMLDVLAVNRDGGGDVYAALLFEVQRLKDGLLDVFHLRDEVNRLSAELKKVASNFKYIVAVDIEQTRSGVIGFPQDLLESGYSEDGIGRVGFLAVQSSDWSGELSIEPLLKAERFRANVASLVDEYASTHSADWEVRI